jgi:hypothetical protein
MAIKRSLTGVIASNAFSSVKETKAAHGEKDYDREVQNCLVAQLLLGLTVEGAANEVGDALFPEWPSEKFENADTGFKWWFLSAHANRTPFHQGAEPLQTITELIKLRNKIAHPKVHDFEGLHLQNISSDIERDVAPNRLPSAGRQIDNANASNSKRSMVTIMKNLSCCLGGLLSP